MTHLTKDSYRRLLSGELPADEARDLARHLDEDCPVCEGFLAQDAGVDALDGRVDAALSALAPPGAGAARGAGNDLEFARIKRQVDAPAVRAPRRAFALAVAAGVLAAGMAGIFTPRAGLDAGAGWDGEKGTAARAVPVRLRFLVVSPGNAVEKGVSGQAVPADAALSFEMDLGRAAEVALVHLPYQGTAEVAWKARLPAGRHELKDGGRSAAISLAGLSGRQRFVLVAAPAGLDDPRALAAAAGGAGYAAARGEAADLAAISVDAVEVVVR